MYRNSDEYQQRCVSSWCLYVGIKAWESTVYTMQHVFFSRGSQNMTGSRPKREMWCLPGTQMYKTNSENSDLEDHNELQVIIRRHSWMVRELTQGTAVPSCPTYDSRPGQQGIQYDWSKCPWARHPNCSTPSVELSWNQISPMVTGPSCETNWEAFELYSYVYISWKSFENIIFLLKDFWKHCF